MRTESATIHQHVDKVHLHERDLFTLIRDFAVAELRRGNVLVDPGSARILIAGESLGASVHVSPCVEIEFRTAVTDEEVKEPPDED